MDYRNILVIKLSAIGDVIHALPAVHALRQSYPDARITWIVEKPSYDLLNNNPDIDQIMIFEKPKFKTLSGLWHNAPELSRLLKSNRFDLAIDFQGLFKSAAISLLSGTAQRIGYCDMRELSQTISRPICGEHSKGHVVERYLDVIRGLTGRISEIRFPIHITTEEIEQAIKIAQEAGLAAKTPYVILAPGTNWRTKCWPTEHYAALSDQLHQAGFGAVLVGGPGDKPLAQDIQNRSQTKPIDLTGKTSLKQLAYMIKESVAFVGGDTGPMHLSVAVNTPAVALFGPTDPARNGPYYGHNTILRPQRPCINCWRRKCEHICLADIQPQTVFEAVIGLIRND